MLAWFDHIEKVFSYKVVLQFKKLCLPMNTSCLLLKTSIKALVAAAVSEPEANERGSSLISRRLHYNGLQSLFLTKRKELWLCASGRYRMRSGMPQ